MPVLKIAQIFNRNESSIRKIVRDFEQEGRINKLVTFSAKRLVLQKRGKSTLAAKVKPANGGKHVTKRVNFRVPCITAVDHFEGKDRNSMNYN